jgi:hypothetical protein
MQSYLFKLVFFSKSKKSYQINLYSIKPCFHLPGPKNLYHVWNCSINYSTYHCELFFYELSFFHSIVFFKFACKNTNYDNILSDFIRQNIKKNFRQTDSELNIEMVWNLCCITHCWRQLIDILLNSKQLRQSHGMQWCVKWVCYHLTVVTGQQLTGGLRIKISLPLSGTSPGEHSYLKQTWNI